MQAVINSHLQSKTKEEIKEDLQKYRNFKVISRTLELKIIEFIDNYEYEVVEAAVLTEDTTLIAD